MVESTSEELQSHNEELTTVNAELKARLEEVGRAHDDLANLIASTELATVFVGHDLEIKRFTPRVAGIFNLIPRDVGRKLLDITHRLDSPQLREDMAATLRRLQPFEREVPATDGRHFSVRVRPYRNADDVVAGAVLAFIDISRRWRAEAEAQDRQSGQEFLLRLGDSLRPLADPMAVLALGCRTLGAQLRVAQLAFGEFRAGRYAMLPGYAERTPPLRGKARWRCWQAGAGPCWRRSATRVSSGWDFSWPASQRRARGRHPRSPCSRSRPPASGWNMSAPARAVAKLCAGVLGGQCQRPLARGLAGRHPSGGPPRPGVEACWRVLPGRCRRAHGRAIG